MIGISSWLMLSEIVKAMGLVHGRLALDPETPLNGGRQSLRGRRCWRDGSASQGCIQPAAAGLAEPIRARHRWIQQLPREGREEDGSDWIHRP